MNTLKGMAQNCGTLDAINDKDPQWHLLSGLEVSFIYTAIWKHVFPFAISPAMKRTRMSLQVDSTSTQELAVGALRM